MNAYASTAHPYILRISSYIGPTLITYHLYVKAHVLYLETDTENRIKLILY